MILWDERFRVGVGRIDDQHKELFVFTNALEEDLREGWQLGKVDEAVRFLVEYAKLHFRHEEDCMLRYQCPVAGINKEAHAKFLIAVEDFQRKLETSPGRELMTEIHEFLQSWLVNHICKIDVKLRSSSGSPPKK